MKTFTKNEIVEFMHKNTAFAFKKTVEHIKKHNLTIEEAITLLEEISDEVDAQAQTINLIDEINK